MAGLFGALFLLACGGAYAHKGITEAIDNNKSREEARKAGRKYYHAIDGERAVDTNHRILRLPDGIKDMETGQWLFDKKKQDALERKQLSELDEISKKEAIIKGKQTYQCSLHESDPRRTGNANIGFMGRYQRLVSNGMPIENIEYDSYYPTGKPWEKSVFYKQAIELTYGFRVPLEYEGDYQEGIFNQCKHYNMEITLKSMCKVYPINKLEVIYKYLKKYNVPLGDWDEIEAMMLEEQPLGWRKVPPCKDWQFEKFMEQFIM